ncbi:MAG: hypothetical protein A3A81_07940 [Omnitrophica bacterium RIFCSPLOWO2_01_FULL_45_10b]|nr:MAG: hypothetical protein A3A81_07940 [Omnitrophica bacterium RIFCSPLOWO2_01_FULL_45_10b]
MIKYFKFWGSKEIKPTTEFSSFFTNADPKTKKQVLSGVVRKANQDQKDLIERYNQVKTKTT